MEKRVICLLVFLTLFSRYSFADEAKPEEAKPEQTEKKAEAAKPEVMKATIVAPAKEKPATSPAKAEEKTNQETGQRAEKDYAAPKSPIRLLGGMGYFMLGWHNLNLGSLNDSLEKNGYFSLGESFMSLGGGGHWLVNKVMIGFEGHALINSDNATSNAENKAELSGGYALFDVGYRIYTNNDFFIYPMLGIGGGGFSLYAKEKDNLDNISKTFDETLQDPKRSTTLHTGCLLLDFSLGANYLVSLIENEKGKGGLVLGLRAGYMFAPAKSNWYFDGVEVDDSPKIGMNGPYLLFSIGGGGLSSSM